MSVKKLHIFVSLSRGKKFNVPIQKIINKIKNSIAAKLIVGEFCKKKYEK